MTGESRTAIVTVASTGIGAARARRLAAAGSRSIVNYVSSAEAAQRVVAVRADVADPSGIKTLFDAAERAHGPVDVLVNDAGIPTVSPLADVDDEHYRRQIAINLTASFNGMREAAKRVPDGGWVSGQVIMANGARN